MTISKIIGCVALSALLVGCNKGEVILSGDRLSPREALTGTGTGTEPLDATAAPAAVAIGLSAQRAMNEWSQRGGNAAHDAGHAAYSGALALAWTAKVGTGNSRKNRISADPVTSGGQIFTLDSDAGLTATAANGATLWHVNLTPATEKSGDASGGGLAVGEGSVFATTGYGELLAIDPASGKIKWRQSFDAAVGGAPAVASGKVFVLARDGSAWAVGASDGRVAWTAPGASTVAGISGAAAPAVAGDTVVFPYATGELMALDVGSGAPKWQAFVAGKRLGRAYASYSDMTGEPVISGNTLFAGSAAGRLAAVDMQTGTNLWSAPDGADSPVVVAGGSVFLVNDEDQLMRLDASTGAEIWRVDLPYFTNDRKDKRRKGIFVHYGPVLAGGRLITASSDGLIRAFDPASGKLVGSAEIRGGAASGPIVSGGVLYVLAKSGLLHAFR